MKKESIPVRNYLLLLLTATIWGVAFVAQSVGMDRFYNFYKAFGLTEPTGIDLPGEASTASLILSPTSFQFVSDIYVYSFDVSFEKTTVSWFL